jgi:hypothetical protein
LEEEEEEEEEARRRRRQSSPFLSFYLFIFPGDLVSNTGF